MTRPTSNPPICPRCGYDQSGAIATWTDHCPLDGTCPECGLCFRWRDVFHPDRDRVRGFFEHTKGFWKSLWAVPKTAWLVARPWTFWKRVQLHMRPRLGRAFAWLWLAGLALLAIKGGLGVFSVALPCATGLWPAGESVVETLVDAVGSPLIVSGGWTGSPWLIDFYVPEMLSGIPMLLLVSVLLWPLSFVLLPTTRRRCKLRVIHLWRGLIYSCAAGLLLYTPWIALNLVEATSIAFWTLGSGPPAVVHDMGYFLYDVVDSGGYGALFALAIWLWLAMWWLFAIRRGFKLPHAWGVWIALLIINALATPLAFALWHIVLARFGTSAE